MLYLISSLQLLFDIDSVVPVLQAGKLRLVEVEKFVQGHCQGVEGGIPAWPPHSFSQVGTC